MTFKIMKESQRILDNKKQEKIKKYKKFWDNFNIDLYNKKIDAKSRK